MPRRANYIAKYLNFATNTFASLHPSTDTSSSSTYLCLQNGENCKLLYNHLSKSTHFCKQINKTWMRQTTAKADGEENSSDKAHSIHLWIFMCLFQHDGHTTVLHKVEYRGKYYYTVGGKIHGYMIAILLSNETKLSAKRFVSTYLG